MLNLQHLVGKNFANKKLPQLIEFWKFQGLQQIFLPLTFLITLYFTLRHPQLPPPDKHSLLLRKARFLP